MNAVRSAGFHSMLWLIGLKAKSDYRIILNKDLFYKRATEFLRGDHCHHKQTLYLRTASNGMPMYFYGCSSCAKRLSQFVSQKTLKDKDKAQPAELFDALCDTKSGGYKALSDFFHGNWWWAYNQYLQSNEWRTLRLKVLKRDGGKCVLGLNGCTRRAIQVHHLTYKRVTREDMNDLVYTCVQVAAPAKIWFTADGKYDGEGVDIDTAKAGVIGGGTVLRCSECECIRRDLEMYDPESKEDLSMFDKLIKPRDVAEAVIGC